MARLNLTIPDSLYERLEQLRDRVNVSKICATALTKELDMIEGTIENNVASQQDRKVERLIARFLQQREIRDNWYRRGRQDGENWAIEKATLEELRMIGEEWDEGTVNDLDEFDELDLDEEEYPTVDISASLERWVRSDLAELAADSRTYKQAREAADWKAYLEGWWHGVRDLWVAARPTLR